MSTQAEDIKSLNQKVDVITRDLSSLAVDVGKIATEMQGAMWFGKWILGVGTALGLGLIATAVNGFIWRGGITSDLQHIQGDTTEIKSTLKELQSKPLVAPPPAKAAEPEKGAVVIPEEVRSSLAKIDVIPVELSALKDKVEKMPSPATSTRNRRWVLARVVGFDPSSMRLSGETRDVELLMMLISNQQRRLEDVRSDREVIWVRPDLLAFLGRPEDLVLLDGISLLRERAQGQQRVLRFSFQDEDSASRFREKVVKFDAKEADIAFLIAD